MLPTIAQFSGEGFYIQQLFTGCLAEMAYYIESNGEAAIIDPMRDHNIYLKLAETRKANYQYIFETHFHADFVSGHFDVAAKTGATIVYGPDANTQSQIYVAKDNEEFAIGSIKLRVLHTPGHTLESSCFLLLVKDAPYCIFTGDTLFLGDVGRPDLAVIDGKITSEMLAGLLYESTRNRIMPLPDETIVFPGHGAGSACGKNIGSGTFCTLGKQKANNYALQKMEQDVFIQTLCQGIAKAPEYFFHDVSLNKNGYEPLDKVVKEGLTVLNMDKFQEAVQSGAIIIDTRTPSDFMNGYVGGSYNVNLVMNFAPWVGNLINANQKLVLITEKGKEEESIIRLARIGYDHVIGCLEGGIQTFLKSGLPICKNEWITTEDFVKNILPTQPTLIDVRNSKEHESGQIEGAQVFPLNDLERVLTNDPKSFPGENIIYIYCKSGGRATTACSILQKFGINQVINIKGGFDAFTVHTTAPAAK